MKDECAATFLIKKIQDDTEDAYVTEVENAEAMNDQNSCRDFLAMMTKHFMKSKGETYCSFQEKHKAACTMLSLLKQDYSHRKLKAYSMPLVGFLLLEEAVEEANDPTIKNLFVEAYKDKETFIKNVETSGDKTDKMMERQLLKNKVIRNNSEAENDYYEKVLNAVREYVEGKDPI